MIELRWERVLLLETVQRYRDQQARRRRKPAPRSGTALHQLPPFLPLVQSCLAIGKDPRQAVDACFERYKVLDCAAMWGLTFPPTKIVVAHGLEILQEDDATRRMMGLGLRSPQLDPQLVAAMGQTNHLARAMQGTVPHGDLLRFIVRTGLASPEWVALQVVAGVPVDPVDIELGYPPEDQDAIVQHAEQLLRSPELPQLQQRYQWRAF